MVNDVENLRLHMLTILSYHSDRAKSDLALNLILNITVLEVYSCIHIIHRCPRFL